MPTLSGKYNIKAVSNIIGVQPSTLRAWERRYQILAQSGIKLGIAYIQKSIFKF